MGRGRPILPPNRFPGSGNSFLCDLGSASVGFGEFRPIEAGAGELPKGLYRVGALGIPVHPCLAVNPLHSVGWHIGGTGSVRPKDQYPKYAQVQVTDAAHGHEHSMESNNIMTKSVSALDT